jgi:gliding motility-associated-like protein
LTRKPFILVCCLLAICTIDATAQLPVANFSASTVSGCGPLAVAFTDLSTGGPILWDWDFGNGQTSHVQNPSISYASAGAYTVKLTVVNRNGQDSITKFDLINVAPFPTSSFTANLVVACQPAGIQFQDNSTPGQGSISTWFWRFGDGATSGQSNPFHVYTQSGYYDVSLIVTNSEGCSSTSGSTRFLRVVSGVQADFAFAQTSNSCSAPFQLGFTNQTAGPGTLNYNWDLGNGNVSTQTNPTTSYPTNTNYTVTLIAQSSLGCSDTIQKNISIPAANAVISSPDSACVNNPVSFKNGSSPAPLSSAWSFGDGNTSTAISPSDTYTSVGSYQVKLVNTYLTCVDSVTKTIAAVIPPTPNFTATLTTACAAPFTASFQDATTPAAGLVKRIWNFGDGTPLDSTSSPTITHNYTVPGSYDVTLTVFNSAGCGSTITKPKFIQVIIPSVILKPAQVGGCVNTGFFQPTAIVTSADSVVSWSWTAPAATPASSTSPTPVFSYSTLGTHDISLTIQTKDGCTVTTNFANAALVGTPTPAVFSVSSTTVCRSTPINFTSTSMPADKWQWNFGDGVFIETDTPGIHHTYKNNGSYNVLLTVINNGCPSSATSPISVQVNPPVAGFSYADSCTDKYKVFFTDTSKVDPAQATTYIWNFGDGSLNDTIINPAGMGSGTPPPHIYPHLGNYTVSLAVSNASCPDATNGTVVLDSLTATFSVLDSVCRNGGYTMTSTSAQPDQITNYSWTIGAAPPVSSDTTPSFNFKPTVNGPLPLGLTITDTHGCKFSSQPFSTQVFGPMAKFDTTTPGGCQNSLIQFVDQTIINPYPIQDWTFLFGDGIDTNFTSAPFTHRYADTGTYNVTLDVEDTHHCVENYTLDSAVHITSMHAGFFAPDTLYCPNIPLPFTDTSRGSNLSWLWDFGDGDISTLENPAPAYPTNGQRYTVKLKISDPAGCSDSVTRISYIHIQSPIAAFTIQDSTSICLPLQTVFIPTPQYYDSLYWDFGDGGTSTLANTVHFYNSYDTFTAKLFLKGAGGCMDSASRRIFVLYPYNTSFTYGPLVHCDSVLTNFLIVPPGFTRFDLSFGDGVFDSSGNTTPSHLYKKPNTYFQQLILMDSTGCIVNIPGGNQVTVLGTTPFFSITKHAFCDSSTVTFTDYTIGDDSITSETWDFGDHITTIQPNPSHDYASPGVYLPTLMVTTKSLCSESYTDTVTVYQTPHPAFIVAAQPCARAPILFTGELTVPDPDQVTWAWNFGDGQTSGQQDPTVVYQQPNVYRVTLKTSIPFGCSDTTSQTISLHSLPTIKGPSEITIAEGFPTTLPFTYSSGIVAYAWTPVTDLSCTDCPDPLAGPIFAMEYKITITDSNNCSVTDSILVKTVCNGKNYFIPNTFSPNGDGVNDVFYPRGDNLSNIQSMRIFNRWGQLVFEKRDFPANSASAGWDGTFNGRPAPVDVYVYTIEVVCDNAQVIALNGNLTLVR